MPILYLIIAILILILILYLIGAVLQTLPAWGLGVATIFAVLFLFRKKALAGLREPAGLRLLPGVRFDLEKWEWKLDSDAVSVASLQRVAWPLAILAGVIVTVVILQGFYSAQKNLHIVGAYFGSGIALLSFCVWYGAKSPLKTLVETELNRIVGELNGSQELAQARGAYERASDMRRRVVEELGPWGSPTLMQQLDYYAETLEAARRDCLPRMQYLQFVEDSANVVELLQQLPQFVRTGQTPPGFDAGAQSPPDKRSRPDYWYKVLGVSPQASWEEIEKTHKEILKRVHSDHLQQLSEGARAFFDEQAKQVGEAFEEIKKLRRIKA